MDQEDRNYTSKVISIQHYHGSIIDGNHGNGTQPNKVFEKHRLNDQLYTILLFMIKSDRETKCVSRSSEQTLIVSNYCNKPCIVIAHTVTAL